MYITSQFYTDASGARDECKLSCPLIIGSVPLTESIGDAVGGVVTSQPMANAPPDYDQSMEAANWPLGKRLQVLINIGMALNGQHLCLKFCDQICNHNLLEIIQKIPLSIRYWSIHVLNIHNVTSSCSWQS